jgi:hypothetical protein
VFDAPDLGSLMFSFSSNNSGDVTGSFIDTRAAHAERGFVRDASGTITVFNAPGAGPDPLDFGTLSGSINNRGDVTGAFFAGFKIHGFVRDRNGNFTVFDAPHVGKSPSSGLVTTFSNSINDRGDVTGIFFDASQGRE